MNHSTQNDLRLIEAGFPCHQVGAETQRERDTGKAPPPNRLHVWWARRPLTPSRAAILASLLPADTDPDWFLRQLGIEKRVVEIHGVEWTLTGKILDKIEVDEFGAEVLPVDDRVLQLLRAENANREKNRDLARQLITKDGSLNNHPVMIRWQEELKPIPDSSLNSGNIVPVERVKSDPAWAKERILFENAQKIRTPESKYGYNRAFSNAPNAKAPTGLIVLDPTSGGGSIPFEAIRLGHTVIANELNPVAAVILHATLDYPRCFGENLGIDIQKWGSILRQKMVNEIELLFPVSPLCEEEQLFLKNYLKKCPELLPVYQDEILDGFLYCRQVSCPNCGGEAPLLNTCWLSKEAGKQWGVKILTDKKLKDGKTWFETYRVSGGKGPAGEDPNFATVNRGIGQCIHCKQAIEPDEIKSQARGESSIGTWHDRLYCVVAVRFQPKLDKHGNPQRYKSGEKAGQIKTEKIRFFRPPNKRDLDALVAAEKQLKANWDRWNEASLIPTERFPKGNDMRPVIYGMNRWCDMFTPRQLLGHLTLVEELNRLKPEIMAELGRERGRAVATYLQFAIDKGLDYNSRQTRWEYTRGIIKGTFGRHDFSLKWTFGEMIFCGPNSGAAWGLSQILDSYKGMSLLTNGTGNPIQNRVTIKNGTAAHLSGTKIVLSI